MVNESSVDGTTNTGAIGCAHPGTPKLMDGTESSLLIHPNPANTQIRVHITTDRDGQGILLMRDAMGRVALGRRVVFLHGGEQSMVLDVSGLANGSYFVELEHNGQRTVQRLLVAH
jgi:hypothetical protein